MKIARKLLSFLLFTVSVAAHASKKKPPVVPSDVLARIGAAHAVFVSNAGEDADLSGMTNAVGAAYREMYQALAGWPGIQMATSPAHVDLIFQVNGTETIDENNNASAFVHLQILDPATHAIFWENDAPVAVSVFLNNGPFAKSVSKILAPIEPLHPKPQPAKTPALVPVQLRTAKKLYTQPSISATSPAPAGTMDFSTALSQAFRQSGSYTLVDSPDQADLILVTTHSNENALYVEVLDPATKTILWNFTNQLVLKPKATLAEKVSETLPYFLKEWKALIGEDHI